MLYSEQLIEKARSAASKLPDQDRDAVNELADRHLVLLAHTLRLERMIHNYVKEAEHEGPADGRA